MPSFCGRKRSAYTWTGSSSPMICDSLANASWQSPGDAGPDEVDRLVRVRVERDELPVLGPWADEAHLSTDDVQELWELVELRTCEESADPCEPIVVRRGECRAGRIVLHLAELQHVELPTALPDSAAPIEDWATVFQPDCDASTIAIGRVRTSRTTGCELDRTTA